MVTIELYNELNPSTLTLSFNRWSLVASECLESSERGEAEDDEIEYLRIKGAPGLNWSSCSKDEEDGFLGSNPLTSQFQRFLCSPILLSTTLVAQNFGIQRRRRLRLLRPLPPSLSLSGFVSCSSCLLIIRLIFELLTSNVVISPLWSDKWREWIWFFPCQTLR